MDPGRPHLYPFTFMIPQNHIDIFDTTLRDGEQCPGASMTMEQKVRIAHQLEHLGVNIIEAGFPVISPGDFNSVETIARETSASRIAGLARCVTKDIDAAARALAPAGERARIHLVLATSPIHRQYKLNKNRNEVLAMARSAVSMASDLAGEVQFSAEDASRTEPDFLAEVTETVIDAGARIVNIPDTVGYAMPDEYGHLISHLVRNVSNIDRAVLSVHCHDDLGMAVANSLAAIRAGARQVEGTINGIGERAGNTALEEVIMALRTRSAFFNNAVTSINTPELLHTSKIVARESGMPVPRSKAIVGANAFAHGSGIHQDGMLKNKTTYEVMRPEDVGWSETEYPLTKHSGRHAVRIKLERLGISPTDHEMNAFFPIFKKAGDQCKFIDDQELIHLFHHGVIISPVS